MIEGRSGASPHRVSVESSRVPLLATTRVHRTPV